MRWLSHRDSVVIIKVLTRPRLLADLIASGLESPAMRRWRPGDPAPTVTIGDADLPASERTHITILLPRQLDRPLAVLIDGKSQSVSLTRPNELHDLILELSAAPGSSSD